MNISNYFKPVQTATPPQPSQAPQAPQAGGPMKVDNDDSDSPLSDCITPSPPEPIPSRAIRNTEPSRFADKSSTTKKPKFVVPDSEGEESDSSLQDVGALLAPIAPKKQAKPVKKMTKSKKDLPVSTKPKKPSYAFSLDNLISEKQKETAREERILQTEALIAFADDDSHMMGLKGPADKSLLEAAVGDDRGREVLEMLNRREAWKAEYTWHFFERSAQGSGAKPRNPFPVSLVPDWLSGINDASTRYQMYLTGYIQDMIMLGKDLPDAIVSWMLDELIIERRGDISYCYAKTLEVCSAQVGKLLSPQKLSWSFEMLGGRKEAVDIDYSIDLVQASGQVANVKPIQVAWRLKVFVRLIGTVAPHLSNDSSAAAAAILMRVSIDDTILKSGEPFPELPESLSSLLMSIPSEHWDQTSLMLSKLLIKTFVDPKAQVRLLKILPITSSRTHLFRRRLALAFLLQKVSYLTTKHEDLVNMSEFSEQLERPMFRIQHGTDYTRLKALVEILDIAIDDGATSVIPGGQSKRVEAIASILKDMSSNIRDAGMASLERTEAKQVIELTQFRLQYSVAKVKKGATTREQHFVPEDNLTRPSDGKRQTVLNFGRK